MINFICPMLWVNMIHIEEQLSFNMINMCGKKKISFTFCYTFNHTNNIHSDIHCFKLKKLQ